jgi:hypothetical protein
MRRIFSTFYNMLYNRFKQQKQSRLESYILVMGLDLAGVETRPTGFCLLRELKAETLQLYSDEEIIK